MDIKSKNTNDEAEVNNDQQEEKKVTSSKKCKIIRTVLIGAVIVLLSIVFLSVHDVKANRDAMSDKNLYQYDFLGRDIEEFAKNVVIFSELYKNENFSSSADNVTDDEYAAAKKYINSVKDREYTTAINNIDRDYNTTGWSEYQYNDKQAEIKQEIDKKYDYTDEVQLKKMIAQYKANNFNKYKNQVDSQINLKYIVHDKSNDLWMSNYEASEEGISMLKGDSGYFAEYHISQGNYQRAVYINGKRVSDKDIDGYNGYYYNRFEPSLMRFDSPSDSNGSGEQININVNGNIDVYISVPRELRQGDVIYTGYENYCKANSVILMQIAALILCTVVTILIGIILKKQKSKESYFNDLVVKCKARPIELVVLIFLLCWFAEKIFSNSYNYGSAYSNSITIINIIFKAIFLASAYLLIRSGYEKYQEKTLFSNSYLTKFYENYKVALEKKSVGKKLTVMLTVYILGCALTFILCLGILEEVGAIVALGVILVATFFMLFIVVRDFAYLNKITNGTKDICHGVSSDNIPEKGRGPLRELAHNINNMKEGLRVSLDNENRSERMKTELITNVSHDLKTPLTSIINYVDLLKRIDVQPEEAKGYVQVLEKKSQRLKVLIEDLFEASKAASGAMQLNLEKLEITALLRQTLGEAEGRIEKADLNFKVVMPKEKIYVNGDGRKLWRVFENLINNIIKYSLNGTRVYVDVKKKDNAVVISMKNISAYELNFDSDEITERFKRGEESRHTEGSGLGLAIAKSIVELHGGTLNIKTDADLFKVEVELNTVEE